MQNTNDDPMNGIRPRTRFGPVPKLPPTRLTAVRLEEDVIRWGKEQPGGLSETVRRLLREAMEGR